MGRALHRALEWVTQADAPLPPAARAEACAAATLAFGVPAAQRAQVSQALDAVLGSAETARFFDPTQLLEAASEITLAYQGELLRIDRLVAVPAPNGGRTWWVLDFKLAAAPQASAAFAAGYREQLARYCAAVRAAQPGDEVRAALITGSGRLVPV